MAVLAGQRVETVIAAPPFLSAMASVALPSIGKAPSIHKFTLGGPNVDSEVASLLAEFRVALRSLDLLDRQTVLDEIASGHYSGDPLTARLELVSAACRALGSQAETRLIDGVEDPGGRLIQRLSEVPYLSFRGRGRVWISEGNLLAPVDSILALSEDHYRVQLGLFGARDVSAHRFDGARARLILRGSIRPVSVDYRGPLLHAPWHSQYSAQALPKGTGLSYPVARLSSPLWQRYETDSGSMHESWLPGSLLSDFAQSCEGIQRYVTASLGAEGPVGIADILKLRAIAMTTHGRKIRFKSSRRLGSALNDLRKLVDPESMATSSYVPSIRAIDSFLSHGVNPERAGAALQSLIDSVSGPLKTTLWKLLLLAAPSELDNIQRGLTLSRGFINLPLKRRRE